MANKVLIMRHAACEAPGAIAEALGRRGALLQTTRLYAGEPVPKEIADAAALVLMGGPMGVYEASHYPFLAAEMRLIDDALRREKPVLGICLGSELLAATLGARVAQGEKKEIGWFPVRLTGSGRQDSIFSGVESPFLAFHWHGDVFDLPRNAVALASSERTLCQAFRCGKAYGLLFHAEVTPAIVEGMVRCFSEELHAEGLHGPEILRQTREHLPDLSRLAMTVFGRWADSIGGASGA